MDDYKIPTNEGIDHIPASKKFHSQYFADIRRIFPGEVLPVHLEPAGIT